MFIFSLCSEKDAIELRLASRSYSDSDTLITKLEHGVDPDHQYYYNDSYYWNGYTPLHRACYYNNPEVVQTLIEWGANIEAVNSRDGHTPLHTACISGSTEALKKILKYCPNTSECQLVLVQ